MTMVPSHRPTAIVAAALALFMLTALQSEAQMEPMAAPMAPGPAAEDCLTVLTGAVDCLSYVEAGNNLTKPEKLCCGEIKGVVNSRPDCLCQMFAKNNSLGIDIDIKKALKLPSICKVSTPPPSMCSLFGVDVPVPAGAPAPSSGLDVPSSGSPVASSPGGSAQGPTAAATTNGHLCGLASLAGAAMAMLLPFLFTF